MMTKRSSHMPAVTHKATKIIAGSSRKIWIFDVAQTALSLIEQAPAGRELSPSIAASPTLLAWTRFTNASGASKIAIYDKFSKELAVSSSSIPGRNLALTWVKNNTLAIIQNDDSLYLYDVSTQQFQKLADDVKNFEAASDGSMIAAVENKSLEIFSFTDANTYHRFNLPDMANVARVLWYKDMNHLFVVYADHVSFLDIDDLGVSNFTTVAQGTLPFYDASANSLYLVAPASKLIRFDFPN